MRGGIHPVARRQQLFYGRREGRRPDRTAEQQARGKLLHRACGFVILAAVAYVLITKWLHQFDEHSLFYGETVAVLAFGLSWLMKGLELDVLLGRATPTPTAPVTVSS